MPDAKHGRFRRFRESGWFKPGTFRGAVLVGLVVLVIGSVIVKPWGDKGTNRRASGSTINKFNYGIDTQNQTGGINEIVQTPVRGSGPTQVVTSVISGASSKPGRSGPDSSRSTLKHLRSPCANRPPQPVDAALKLSSEAPAADSAGTLVAEGGSVLEAKKVIYLVGRIVGWNEPGAKARGWGDDGKLTEAKIVAPYSKRKVYAVMAEPIRAHYGEVVFARCVVVAVGYGRDSNPLTAVVLLESLNHEYEAARHSAVSRAIRDFHTRNPHRGDG